MALPEFSAAGFVSVGILQALRAARVKGDGMVSVCGDFLSDLSGITDCN